VFVAVTKGKIEFSKNQGATLRQFSQDERDARHSTFYTDLSVARSNKSLGRQVAATRPNPT